jgi:hypothetical protein
MLLKGVSVTLKKQVSSSHALHIFCSCIGWQKHPTEITEVRSTVLNVGENKNIKAPRNPLQSLKYRYTRRNGNTNLI